MSTSVQKRIFTVIALAAAPAVVTSTAHAAVVYNSIPRNYMVSQPIYMATPNLQNIFGDNAAYPENPNVADGDIASYQGLNANQSEQLLVLAAAEGVDSNGNPETPTSTGSNEYYAPSAFVQGSYGTITDIRIWTSATNSYQFNAPSEVAIYYSTQSNPEVGGGGWWGNIPGVSSSNVLTGPGDYTNVATILGVSGSIAPTSAGDSSNPDAVALTSSNYTVDTTDTTDSNGRSYVDLTVAIPAGATSLLFDFGTSPGYAEDVGIADIQASALSPVPEPASIGVLGMAAAGLLVRRRRGRSA